MREIRILFIPHIITCLYHHNCFVFGRFGIQLLFCGRWFLLDQIFKNFCTPALTLHCFVITQNVFAEVKDWMEHKRCQQSMSFSKPKQQLLLISN